MRNRFGIAAVVALALATGGSSVAWARPYSSNHDYRWSRNYYGGWHGRYYRPGSRYAYRHGWYGGSYPPGWSRGLKRGWRGRGVPPGLYGR